MAPPILRRRRRGLAAVAAAAWTPASLGTAVKGWFEADSWYVNSAGYPSDPSDETENAGYARNLAPSATWHADTVFSAAPVTDLTAGGKKFIVGNGTDQSLGKNANADFSSTATAGFVSCIFSFNATDAGKQAFCIPSTSGTRYLYFGTISSSGTRVALVFNDSAAGTFGAYSTGVTVATSTMYQISFYQSGSGYQWWWGTGTGASATATPTWTATPTGYDTFWFNSFNTTKPSRYSFLSRVAGVTATGWGNANFFAAVHVEGTVSAGDLTSLVGYMDDRRINYYV